MDFELDGVIPHIIDLIARIDADAVVRRHLNQIDYTIHGYWHGEEYFEEVTIGPSIHVRLVDAAVGVNASPEYGGWIRLRFALEAADVSQAGPTLSIASEGRVADLALIFDANSQFIDEQWTINRDSPLVGGMERKV